MIKYKEYTCEHNHSFPSAANNKSHHHHRTNSVVLKTAKKEENMEKEDDEEEEEVTAAAGTGGTRPEPRMEESDTRVHGRVGACTHNQVRTQVKNYIPIGNSYDLSL
ncbi:unnamed protein product [Brassica napus]|uniref:(rape) hypothetical protein n=1 Tax=Brassica napus TaxID=3708 RepID=A0A816UHB8_BRANA|nr:unnamed protein product [Brassica napus]